MDKARARRSDNWCQEEKDLFVQIMSESAKIIEDKRTDTNTNKRKSLEWINVQRKFCELSGKTREVEQLKGAWRRIRGAAKKRVGEHKKSIRATGGGEKPLSPTEEDKKIMDICPTDFIVDENVYDSDGIFNKQVQDDSKEKVIVEEVIGYQYQDYRVQAEDQGVIEVGEKDDIPAECDEEVAIINTTLCDNSKGMQPRSLQGSFKENISQNTKGKKHKIGISQKASILKSNMEIKEKGINFIKEEHNLKIKLHKNDLYHQELKHKLEIEILMLKKEKETLEIQILKNKNSM